MSANFALTFIFGGLKLVLSKELSKNESSHLPCLNSQMLGQGVKLILIVPKVRKRRKYKKDHDKKGML